MGAPALDGTHGKAVGLFWLLFSSLSFTLYGLFRRLFLACLPGGGGVMGWPSPAGIR